MRTRDRLERWLLKRADQCVDRLYRRPPPANQLAKARIVAHRGVYDNRRVFENTLAAFALFHKAGGWGVELDIHWTRDGVPVVSHDPDGLRLFGVIGRIADTDLATLQHRLPLVPTLESVISRFGGQLHLMIEVKALPPSATVPARDLLAHCLGELIPGRDYHLLSLDPELLARLQFKPAQACLPIAQLNRRKITRAADTHAWGGIAGHYTMIGSRTIADLHRRGLRVGTGYINTSHCLFREVTRGVDWLFSDNALTLQKIVAKARTARTGEAPGIGR